MLDLFLVVVVVDFFNFFVFHQIIISLIRFQRIFGVAVVVPDLSFVVYINANIVVVLVAVCAVAVLGLLSAAVGHTTHQINKKKKRFYINAKTIKIITKTHICTHGHMRVCVCLSNSVRLTITTTTTSTTTTKYCQQLVKVLPQQFSCKKKSLNSFIDPYPNIQTTATIVGFACHQTKHEASKRSPSLQNEDAFIVVVLI